MDTYRAADTEHILYRHPKGGCGRKVWRASVDTVTTWDGRRYVTDYTVVRVDGSTLVTRDRVAVHSRYGVCPSCGEQAVKGTTVRGTYSDKECDARCESATGPSCECRCKGENHGAGHGA